jgi:hypothetical protein
MKRAVVTMVTTVAVGGLGAGCAPGGENAVPEASRHGEEFVLTGVRDVTRIAKLIGPDAVNDTEAVAVAGADLGSMLNVGERTYFFFGDTFGVRAPDSYGGQGENWRSNTVAWTTDDDPSDGITFDGWVADDLGLAREIAPGLHEPDGVGEVTKIPTYAFEVDGAIYAFFMSVRSWGDPGVWEAGYAGLVRSDDEGRSWTVLDTPRWPGDGQFVQVSTVRVREDGRDYVYLWGIPAGRFGALSLMKVPATRAAVEDPSSYRYLSGIDDEGRPIWSESQADAQVVLDDEVGEFSVIYDAPIDRWLIAYTTGGDAVLREGLSPWGPWGERLVLTTQQETPGLYAPYLNPRYMSADGRQVYFTLSIWGPYAVFWYSADFTSDEPGESASDQRGR